ncbi:hypothetical protein L6452_09804 [Arctium lappa]|uniref:Uncharacterized protein n=1 Tax=Arctium lappa TaxID=4217 RepID=A0ACB9DLI6_ARCLA|nr:hypothetical protein L6452_09804 [Arctium lappa]
MEGSRSFRQEGQVETKIRRTISYTEACWRGILQFGAADGIARSSPCFPRIQSEKCLAESDVVIPLEDIQIDERISFVEEPVVILDRKVKKLRSKEISLVKVQWQFHKGQEATWEPESVMRNQYPGLFDEGIPGTTFF